MRELIKFFAWRIKRDDIAIEAGALAYTSVLALVPAVTVVLSIFAMIPAFSPLKEEMMNFASANFMPVFSDAVGNSLSTFVAHAGSMTVTGSLMLFVVSLMMIRAIDRALNRIWRGGRRRIPMTFAIYWTMLTVGPLSFGLVLWFSSKLIASNLFASMELAAAIRFFYFVMPFFVEAAMIFVVYSVIPVAPVKARDALVGAIFVAISFELLKRLFSIFIINFSDYEAIYGALAAAPVLMIWIYLNWWLILIGAEITAVLGVVRGGQAEQVPQLIKSFVSLMSSKKEAEDKFRAILDPVAETQKPRSINVHVSPNRGHEENMGRAMAKNPRAPAAASTKSAAPANPSPHHSVMVTGIEPMPTSALSAMPISNSQNTDKAEPGSTQDSALNQAQGK